MRQANRARRPSISWRLTNRRVSWRQGLIDVGDAYAIGSMRRGAPRALLAQALRGSAPSRLVGGGSQVRPQQPGTCGPQPAVELFLP